MTRRYIKWVFAGLTVASFGVGIFFFSLYQTVDTTPEAFADTGGPTGAGTAASETGTCSDNMNWGTPSTELSANDTTYVSYTGNNFDTGEISDGLYASNFGFTTSGTIDGIQVEIINFSDGTAWEYEDIVLGTAQGTRVGADKADSTEAAPTSDPGSTYDSWGGSADTWSAGLTSAQVNDAGFGVEFCWQAGANNVKPSIDHVRVTVTYTPSGARQRAVLIGRALFDETLTYLGDGKFRQLRNGKLSSI